MATRALIRIAKHNFTKRMLIESKSVSSLKLSSPINHMRKQSFVSNVAFQRFGYSSNATSENNEKEPDQSRFGYSSNATSENNEKEPDQSRFGYSSNATSENNEKEPNQSTIQDSNESAKAKDEPAESKQSHDQDTANDLTVDDLAKLLAEKEEQLVLKHKEVEKMQDKVLRSYAEMENVLDRTKREAENTKKFAIQKFAKSLLDVADNLGRASSVVKESFSKVDASKDSAGAVPLLKTLLEGVEMTEKQLSEVFKKSGVEKFDPTNEKFDPHRHHAVFQMPDKSKPSGTIAAVIKPGYMLYDRVLRPAEVGVTEGGKVEESEGSSDDE